MEQILVALSPFTRRCGSLAVSHQEQELPRGLEPGEHVVLHDSVRDEHYSAIVADLDIEATDTFYRVEIGARITAEDAAEWTSPPAGNQLTTGDIVALLAELRRSERDISAVMAGIQAR